MIQQKNIQEQENLKLDYVYSEGFSKVDLFNPITESVSPDIIFPVQTPQAKNLIFNNKFK